MRRVINFPTEMETAIRQTQASLILKYDQNVSFTKAVHILIYTGLMSRELVGMEGQAKDVVNLH